MRPSSPWMGSTRRTSRRGRPLVPPAATGAAGADWRAPRGSLAQGAGHGVRRARRHRDPRGRDRGGAEAAAGCVRLRSRGVPQHRQPAGAAAAAHHLLPRGARALRPPLAAAAPQGGGALQRGLRQVARLSPWERCGARRSGRASSARVVAAARVLIGACGRVSCRRAVGRRSSWRTCPAAWGRTARRR
eukprot:scaffold98_cov307-Prasinococcus_capsulatus_cf.AAC.7